MAAPHRVPRWTHTAAARGVAGAGGGGSGKTPPVTFVAAAASVAGARPPMVTMVAAVAGATPSMVAVVATTSGNGSRLHGGGAAFGGAGSRVGGGGGGSKEAGRSATLCGEAPPLGHTAGGLRAGDPPPAVVSSGNHTVVEATTEGRCQPVGVPLAVGRLGESTRRSSSASS